MLPYRTAFWSEAAGAGISLGTIQHGQVGTAFEQTKTISGLTIDASATKILVILQFGIPYNYTDDYTPTSVKYNGVEMTKLYWSVATPSGAGLYNSGKTLYLYLDSPPSSGDLVVDWPGTNLNYTVAATLVNIVGAASGGAAFGAMARFEAATGTTAMPLSITPTQSGSWLFAAASRRDNTDGATTWNNSTLNSGEIAEWAGGGGIEAGSGASAYRTSANTSPHDVGAVAQFAGAANDYRSSIACVELLAA